MDFSFGEEEQAVSELARKILEDQATNERLKELEASEAAYDETLRGGWTVPGLARVSRRCSVSAPPRSRRHRGGPRAACPR